MATLNELIRHLAPAHTGAVPGGEIAVTAVTADSRAVESGAVFFALSGGRFDGHRYALDALEQGALLAVGTLAPFAMIRDRLLPHGAPYLQVADSRAALAAASAFLHGFPSRALTVIGVTGTDGKTTTSSLLEAILAQATQTPESPAGAVGVITTVGARIRGREADTGLHVTTPDAPEVQRFLAEMRAAGCTYAVVESTSHGLDQQRVSSVDFDLAAVTNITHEHLDYHGTRDAYVAAKARLFRSLFHSQPKPGVPRCAVLNADDAGSFGALTDVLAQEHAATDVQIPVRSYGLHLEGKTLDVAAEEIEYRPDGTRFDVRWWGGRFPLQSRLIGEFNVSNVLAAVTVALALEIPAAQIQSAVAAFAGVLGRMERMDRGQEFTAVIDFAHSPASLERALLTLRPLVGSAPDGTPGRLIAVFGSAGLRDRAKRKWMGQVSGRLADYTVITAEDPRTEDVHEICREIETGVREFVGSECYRILADRSEAIQAAVDMARPGDIVAAFGKGHERSMCYGETEYPWSDQATMNAALDRRMAADRA